MARSRKPPKVLMACPHSLRDGTSMMVETWVEEYPLCRDCEWIRNRSKCKGSQAYDLRGAKDV